MVVGRIEGLPRRRKYRLTPSEAYDWCIQYEVAKNYLLRLNSCRVSAAMRLWLFCEWAKLNPVELLELKSDPLRVGGSNPTAHRLDAERLLDTFCCTAKPLGMPDSVKWSASQIVRGFFRVNYWMLEKQAGCYDRPDNSKPQRFQTKAQRFDLYRACYSPRDRFFVLASLSTGIALETMGKWRFSHFENDWMRQEVPCAIFPSEVLKGHGKGRYRGVKQVTFLTPECKRALLEYRDWFSRNFNYQWRSDDCVFLCVRTNATAPMRYYSLSKVALAVSRRSGVGFGIHDGRRIVQTALESVGTSPQWIRKIKGRKIAGEESPYSKPCIEQLRGKFREALPELEFLGSAFRSGEETLSDEEIKDMRLILEQVKAGHLVYKP